MTPIPLGILDFPTAAGAYDLLETQVLTSSAASVTFTGLDSFSDYENLQIRAVARRDLATTGNYNVEIVLNNDTGNNYAYHYLQGNGSSVTSSRGTSTDDILILDWMPSGNETANAFGAAIIDILDFSSSSKNTTIRALAGANTSNNEIGLYSGLYNSTDAVTEVRLEIFGSSNFVTGSRFSLFGVR